MFKSILVAIDGSEPSKRALETACDLASRYDAALHVVHVPYPEAQEKTLVMGAAAVTIKATPEEIQAAGQAVIADARKLLDAAGCTGATTEVAGGDPAHAIADSAERNHSDLVVMGRRGLSDLKGLVVGSTSHKVSHLIHCACLTVA